MIVPIKEFILFISMICKLDAPLSEAYKLECTEYFVNCAITSSGIVKDGDVQKCMKQRKNLK
jgi:hypothetical protein